jgi:hypothetical protein
MSNNENDFEALRRLLALKRHEVPPPGYFEDFSSRVVGRIRANEAAAEIPWMLRFFSKFEAKPGYPVAVASALCMLLLYGIVSVEQNPELASSALPVAMSDTGSSFSSTQPLMAMANTNDLSLFGAQPQTSSSVGSFQQTGFNINGN